MARSVQNNEVSWRQRGSVEYDTNFGNLGTLAFVNLRQSTWPFKNFVKSCPNQTLLSGAVRRDDNSLG